MKTHLKLFRVFFYSLINIIGYFFFFFFLFFFFEKQKWGIYGYITLRGRELAPESA